MNRYRILGVALAALVLAGGNAARPARADDQPTGIRVRGQGVVSARPDIALLSIGASVRRDTAGAAFERAESLVAGLTESLKASGVSDSDIQTRQFNLNPEFGRGDSNNPPPVVGWRAVHTLSVKIRDFSRIGRTVDNAVTVLGNDVLMQGISFSIEDTDALARQARAQAIQNARTNAEDMAARAGVRLGRISYIQETSAPPPSPVREAAVAASFAAAPAGAQVSPGELTINVSVEMIFGIE